MATSLVLPLSARQDPPLVRASGQPIVDCTGATLGRLEAGMGPQREALRRTEEQYRQALSGHLEDIDATRDTVRRALQSWALDQLKTITVLRNLKLSGVPVDVRRQYATWTERLRSSVERIQAAVDSGKAGYALGTDGFTNHGAMLEQFLTFLQDSGLSDASLGSLAAWAAPGFGNAAVLGAGIMRDLALSGLTEANSGEHLAQMQRALEAMRYAVRRNEERITNLRALMAENCQKAAAKPQESPKPIPPQEAAPPPPPQPAAKQPKAKDKHVGRAVAIGMIAAGVGGGLAAKSLAQASSTSSGDSFGGSGGTPTIVDTHQPWICSGSLCKGQLTINFPVVMNSGTITVGTDSLFLGQKPVSPTSPAGTVTFDMEKSRNPSTCYGTQTTVGIWNSSVISVNGVPVAAAYQLSTSIRIECR